RARARAARRGHDRQRTRAGVLRPHAARRRGVVARLRRRGVPRRPLRLVAARVADVPARAPVRVPVLGSRARRDAPADADRRPAAAARPRRIWRRVVARGLGRTHRRDVWCGLRQRPPRGQAAPPGPHAVLGERNTPRTTLPDKAPMTQRTTASLPDDVLARLGPAGPFAAVWPGFED